MQKMKRDKDLQQIKDRRHAAYTYKFHLIDLLRMSKFTIGNPYSAEMGEL